MPDIYPYPEVNETLGINEIAEYVGIVTGGMFFPLTLLAIFVISLVTTMAFGFGRAWVYSCFFCSILAIFFVVAGLLNPAFMYLLFVMLAGGLLALRLSKSSPLPQI